MNVKKDTDPEWKKSSLANIDRARKDWEGIRSKGDLHIRQGMEITRAANKRLDEIAYAERLLRTNQPNFVLTDSIVSVTGASFATAVNSFAGGSKEAFGLLESMDRASEHDYNRFRSLVDGTSVTSVSIVYMGVEMEKRIETINPGYRPVYEVAKPQVLGSHQQTLDVLRKLVSNYDPKFLHMLDGSEDALTRQGTDNLSQAAHSMRDLFQQLIEHLAPPEAVRSQPWFIATSEAPEGVSRRSRIKFLLYGSGKSYDDESIRRFDEEANHAKTALDLAISRAHNHDPSLTPGEVEVSIDHARYWLTAILKRFASRI